MGVFSKMDRPDWMTDAEWEEEERHRRFYRNRMIHSAINGVIGLAAIAISLIALSR